MKRLRFYFPILLAVFWFLLPGPAQAFLGVSFDFFAQPEVTLAPPPLLDYAIPEAPGDNYFWAPGHWSWNGSDYFWVPGTWVLAPEVGFLWTPGYWGFNGGRYHWSEGYWGSHVGFYGGVHYGGGYNGVGFAGGSWSGRSYHRNAEAFRHGSAGSSASFNGGPGGTTARASAAELSAGTERHLAPTQAQVTHATAASRNNSLTAAAHHGHSTPGTPTQVGSLAHDPVARPSTTHPVKAAEHQVAAVKTPAVARPASKARAIKPPSTRAAAAVQHPQKMAAPARRPTASHATRPRPQPRAASHSSSGARGKKK